jgi:protocatechuate 3,4-dioxygenase beta subunit
MTSNRILRMALGMAAAGTILVTALAPSVFAQAQPLTVAETEGPYFKTNSPERTSLLDDTTQGTVLTIGGQVLAPDGTPIANALLDFWQADPSGQYDNSGYTLRGHQYTDANGNYTLTTVVPGLYPGRTRHIHVKVQAPNGPVFTTQLFFPGEARNSTDGIFDPSLVLNTQTTADGTSESANFNFVVNAG